MRSRRILKDKMLKVKNFRDHWPKAENRLGRYLNRD